LRRHILINIMIGIKCWKERNVGPKSISIGHSSKGL
jgi:hypothetical protein